MDVSARYDVIDPAVDKIDTFPMLAGQVAAERVISLRASNG